VARVLRSFFALFLIAFATVACGDARDGSNTSSSTDTQSIPDPDQAYVVDKKGRAPVISIHAERICSYSSPGEWLRLAVWEDGDVVWSRDLKEGGPPYLKARINERVVADTVSRMARELEAAKSEELTIIGLQTKNSHINTWIDGRYVEVATCHEHVPAERWPSHPNLEHVWNQLLATATSILPADGVECSSEEIVVRVMPPALQRQLNSRREH